MTLLLTHRVENGDEFKPLDINLSMCIYQPPVSTYSHTSCQIVSVFDTHTVPIDN